MWLVVCDFCCAKLCGKRNAAMYFKIWQCIGAGRCNMNGTNTYAERNNGINLAEDLFETYCKEKSYFCKRLSFDEKNGKIPNFFNLNILILYIIILKKCHKAKTLSRL